MAGPSTVPAPGRASTPGKRGSVVWSLVGGLEAALAFAGPFLLTEGLLQRRGEQSVGGLLLVVAAVGLFLWEIRRAPLSGFLGFPTGSGARGAPWWTRRTPWVGRYLCVSCGFRQEEKATFCPRCGKVLVRLPPPVPAGTGPPSGGSGP